MGIAAFGAGAMGLVRGTQMAAEDRRKEEEAQFQKEQRDWMRADRKEADDLKAGLQRVRAAGEYEDVDPLAAAEGLDPSMLPKTKVTRTDADVMRDQSRVYQKFGKVTEAAQMSGAARQERKGAREDDLTAQRQKLFVEAGEMRADARRMDPQAFFAKWGEQWNGGMGGPFANYKAFPSADGTKLVHVDDKGVAVRETPLTREGLMGDIDGYLDARLSMLSPEDYDQGVNRNLKRRQVGAAERTAGAAETRASADVAQVEYFKNRPLTGTGGDGRFLTISPDGKTMLGQFGGVRPIPGGGASAPRPIPEADALALNKAAIAIDEAKTPAERAAAQRTFNNLQAIAFAKVGKVLAPREPREAQRETKVNPDGSVVGSDGRLYVPDGKGGYGLARGLPGYVNPYVQALGASGQDPFALSGGRQAAPVQSFNIDYNKSAFSHWLDAAQRGDAQGKSILQGWVETNSLTAGERAQALKALGR